MYFRVPMRSLALSLSFCICTSAYAMPEFDAPQNSAETNATALGQVSLGSTPKPKPQILTPTLHAHIDLTAQRMTVKSDGQTLHHWSISSGRDLPPPLGPCIMRNRQVLSLPLSHGVSKGWLRGSPT